MKKPVIILSILFFIVLLSGEVCWDNGKPIYEGNFIFSEKSAKTDANNIFITWSEKENELRKLKLQKLNSQGEPIWTHPKTIDQNQEMIIEKNIVKSDNDGCFINAYYEGEPNGKLYKIDSNGNIIWQTSYNLPTNTRLLPLENGGIISAGIENTNNEGSIACTYFSDNGSIIWNNQIFTSISYPNLLSMQFVGGYLYFLIQNQNDNQVFLLKMDQNANVINQSASFEAGFHTYSKFINNSFFIFYQTYDQKLQMHHIDLEGNSLLDNDPKTICNLEDYENIAGHFPFSDDYFYAVTKDADFNFHFKRCDFDGNILNDFSYNFQGSYDISDQQTDFVTFQDYSGNRTDIFELTENGFENHIYIYQDEKKYWRDKYYINGSYNFVGNSIYGDEKIYSLHANSQIITFNPIRDNICDIINKVHLTVQNSDLYAFWYSQEFNSIIKQKYDSSGNPQYQTNGTILIPDVVNYKIFNNRIYVASLNDNDPVAYISCYNFDGVMLWRETFSVDVGYHGYPWVQKIYSFYDGYIFVLNTTNNDKSNVSLEYITFDENGLTNQQTTHLENLHLSNLSNIKVMGNNLFFMNDNTVYDIKINPDGTYNTPQILSTNTNSIGFRGKDENFFVEIHSNGNKLFYFHNGEQVWNEPWDINFLDDAYISKVFFEEDGFYLLAKQSPNTLVVDKFDYDRNLIEDKSFTYQTQYPYLLYQSVYKKNDKFVFVFSSYQNGDDSKLSYLIANENGEIVVPEFSETVITRNHFEMFYSTLNENNLYLAIGYGYKPIEGEYERNWYAQKLDLSEPLSASDNILNIQKPHLSNYPNPFNPQTTISFNLPKNVNSAKIVIYNLKGQKIKSFALSPNSKSIVWDGTDNLGKSVSSGIYFYRLVVDGKGVDSKKCVLLK